MQDAGQTSCDEVLPDAVQVPQPPDVIQVPDVEEPDVQELDHDDDLYLGKAIVCSSVSGVAVTRFCHRPISVLVASRSSDLPYCLSCFC